MGVGDNAELLGVDGEEFMNCSVCLRSRGRDRQGIMRAQRRGMVLPKLTASLREDDLKHTKYINV